MADVSLVARNVAAAPKAYSVPGAQEFILKAVTAAVDGTSASGPFQPVLQMVSPAGDVMWTAVGDTIAAGGSAAVSWFPGAEVEEEPASGAGVIVETLLLDTRISTGVTSSTVLTSGVEYQITAQGTFSNVNHALDVGTPNANAIFPTSPPPARSSTQVGFDPECIFAFYSVSGGGPLGHTNNNFTMNLGSGFTYVTPQGGPFATPQPNYLYTYRVTGQGSTASFKFNDAPGQFADNYGYIQVTIQSLSGSGTGGGGGSLVPPIGAENSLLRVVSSVPAWEAQPDISAADLAMLDGNAAHYLDGTGHMTTPGAAGGVTSLDSLTGALTLIPGSNITITDNSPSAGNIKITATPGAGGFQVVDYAQITASVSVSSHAAPGTTIVTGAGFTADGSSEYLVEFFAPAAITPAAGSMDILLVESASAIGRLAGLSSPGSGGLEVPVRLSLRLVPTAAAHTYTVSGTTPSGTGTIGAGAGTGTTFYPAYIMVTRLL